MHILFQPIHLITRNQSLPVFKQKDKNKATVFIRKLLKAYPESILEKDKLGRIPFIDVIDKWIETEHNRNEKEYFTTDEFIPGLYKFHTTIPTNVVLHPMVDIAISLFSSELNFRDVEICKVAVNVASIPFIVKTILLIEDNDTRHRVMDTSLFKRIILHPRSVGLWMISLLRAGGIYSTRCVDYLQKVNDLNVENLIGRHRKANPSDIDEFQSNRRLVRESIAKNNKYFITSLALLPQEERSRAFNIKMVNEIIEDEVSDSFVKCIYINDILMLLALILSVRTVLYVNGLVNMIPVLQANRKKGLLIPTKNDIICIKIIVVYFIARIYSKVKSLLSVSFHVCMMNLLSSTWLLIVAMIMTLIVSSKLEVVGYFTTDLIYISITMGFLWVCLIQYLGYLSKSIHLFTSTIRYVSIDVVIYYCSFKLFMIIVADDWKNCLVLCPCFLFNLHVCW